MTIDLHLITEAADGDCSVPPTHPAADADGKVHMDGMDVFCEKHCPHCNLVTA